MKKTSLTKKIVAAILAVIMVFSALPTVAFAADDLDQPGQIISKSGSWQTSAPYVTIYMSTDLNAGAPGGTATGSLNYTFAQMKDNEQFDVTLLFSMRKNNSVNSARLENLSSSGLPVDVEWKFYNGSGDSLSDTPYPCDIWDKDYQWHGTYHMTADGSAVYNGKITITFLSGSWSLDRDRYTQEIPITITVIDKRPLVEAIRNARTKEADLQYYTDITAEEFTKALEAAEAIAPAATVVTQKQVTDAVNNLNGAVRDLQYKPADYSKLNAAMDAAEALLGIDNADDVYTIETLADLREAYAAAEDVAPGLDITKQSVVDKAAVDLDAAVKGILKFANYSVMQGAVNAFSMLNPAYYDSAAFNDVKEQVDAAIEEMKLENKLDSTQQDDVTARGMALLQAVNALKGHILPADYADLQKAIDAATALLESDEIGNYTESSVTALRNAVVAGRNVAQDLNIMQQDQIDALTDAINTAMKLTFKGANYEKLIAAIDEANAALQKSDLGDYTEDSVAALREALAAAEEIRDQQLTIDKQSVIDTAAFNLLQAIELTPKPADTSELEALITARTQEVADAKESGLYTEASIARVETAIENATAVANAGYSIKEQSKVEDAYKALNSVALEKQLADYSKLNAAIEAAQETLNNAGDEYTEASKEALRQAISDARAVVAAKYDVSQQQLVNDAVTALQAVQLELKDADYSALDEAIQAAEDFLADPENKELYTEDSLQKVQDALDAAKDVDRDLNITEQDQIDSAVADLTESMQVGDGNLEYKDANIGALQDAIDAANAKLSADDIADYTDDSVNALKDALKEAEDLLASNPDASEQAAVNAAVEKLKGIELVLKGADYSALEEAVRAASERYVQAVSSGNYTEDSLAKLNAAITAASEVPEGLTIKQQHIIDEAIANLNVELVLKPADTGALSDAISAAEDKLANRDNYTEDSVAALQQAIDEAKELLASDPDVSQADEIQAAIDKINNTELVLKGADYTVLDAQIKTAEDLLAGDTSNFTKDSLAVLKTALADAKNVDRYLTIQDQADVDTAAAALASALETMQTYTPLTSVTIVPLNSNDWKEGELIYHKTPWYQTWTSQTVPVGFEINDGAAVKSVTWSYAKWSVDEPEANIENATNESATIRPTFGVGPRSCWIQVTVEDHNGNSVTSDPVKVRFYNWDWQIK